MTAAIRHGRTAPHPAAGRLRA